MFERPGSGSLAHEWLHAFGHVLSHDDDLASGSITMPRWPRRRAPARQAFACALAGLDPALARFALAVLTSPVHGRTRKADQFRSGAYPLAAVAEHGRVDSGRRHLRTCSVCLDATDALERLGTAGGTAEHYLAGGQRAVVAGLGGFTRPAVEWSG